MKPTSKKRLLQADNIRFHYRDRQVLNNIDLLLDGGTCTALVGPNGAGKTTLLRILAGALEPASGSILFEGRSLREMERRERSRLIALVPQHLDVPFDFTVQQIVEQGRTPYLSLLRGLMGEDRLAVDRALELTDCISLRRRIFNELSGGERQRVKIALGVAQDPTLLLLDEPTQSLDIGRQSELIDLLHHLREQGITILASMHDLHLVQHNFSAVHLLAQGRPLISGTPAEVLTHTNLATAFACAPGRHPLLRQTTSTAATALAEIAFQESQ